MKRKSWFDIRNAATTGGRAEVYIYDDIGLWGLSANDFVAALSDLGDVAELDVRINSSGGSVIEGVAIFNALARHPAKKFGYVDSIAASIASLISMACDHLTIYDTSMMMVHRASAGAGGTSDELRQCADVLDMIDKMLTRTYAARTGKSSEEIMALLDATTYMDAQQAVDLGFADEVAGASPDAQPPATQNQIDQYIRSIAAANTRELIAASAHMPQWLNASGNQTDGSGRRDHGQKKEVTKMNINELKAQIKEMAGIDVDGLTNKVTTLETELTTAKTEASEAKASLSEVIGDGSVEDAAAAIAAGTTYRASLEDDVIAARRQLKLTGDSDEDVAAAKALLTVYSLEQLEAESKALAAKASGSGQLRPKGHDEQQPTSRKSHRKTKSKK